MTLNTIDYQALSDASLRAAVRQFRAVVTECEVFIAGKQATLAEYQPVLKKFEDEFARRGLSEDG